ncbi:MULTISPECIES: single-stranded DNA-binding protein [unclassified Spiroplasma]|uniref:single-stranded DNA-binding protein n=1 Tax=unclassified Spiroplasma TaxID=2637901 RepID=UPI0027E1E312|nr:single-stranded DNA-binding protein [Spiroplasma sp. AdecLV25b]
MNNVSLTGRIARSLALRKSSTGKSFLFFTVAVGNAQNQTDFIPCIAWNKVAENMATYLVKGSLVSVSGRLSTRKSTYEGKDQYITEVVAQTVTFLDNRKKEAATVNANYSKPQNEPKVQLDEAFKVPNYNTDIKFTNENSLNHITSNDSSFDDEEAIIWD